MGGNNYTLTHKIECLIPSQVRELCQLFTVSLEPKNYIALSMMECLPRSGSFVNTSFVNDDDSDFAEEDLSDFTGSRNSFQFDYNTTEDNHVAYM